MLDFIVSHLVLGVTLLGVVLALVLHKFVLRMFGVVVIPENGIGIVTKKFVLFGANKSLPDGAVVALNGEAGVQADTLAPGVHFWLWPWQYKVEQLGFVTINRDQLGVVTARDGRTPTDGRVLGQSVACDSFQDARAFLTKGGERGPQIAIITPGTYRINLQLFLVGAANTWVVLRKTLFAPKVSS